MKTKYYDFLNEYVNDYSLYHFTDLDSLKSILKDGYIQPDYDKMLGYGISTTRYKNFKWVGDCKVRLTLDKNELSTRFKIKPYHWFNMKHNYDGRDDYRKYGHDAKPFTNQNIPANQFEERIVTEKQIPVSYIKEIKILSDISAKDLNNLIKSTNIPIISK